MNSLKPGKLELSQTLELRAISNLGKLELSQTWEIRAISNLGN